MPEYEFLRRILLSWRDNQEKLLEFLEFVTGSAQEPLGQLCHGYIWMDYRDGVVAVDSRLPTSRNCFNTLDIYQYSSHEVMEFNLNTAVMYGGSSANA